MPTIKLQNGNVILKDGKASCSCCEEQECCFFPAFELGNLFEVADLPDGIDIATQQADKVVGIPNLTSEVGFLVGDGTTAGDIAIVWQDNGDFLPPDERFRWVSYELIPDPFDEFAEPEWELIGIADDVCLFAVGNVQTDLFEDEYTIAGPAAGSVERNDFCRWSGSGLILFFNSEIQKWQVNGNAKDGNQNSPVGDYAGGFSVS